MVGRTVSQHLKGFKTIYSVKSVGMMSGYSIRSDLKASRVGADTVLAGRMFHSLLSSGKYEFASTWSVNHTWNSRCWRLVRASLLCIKLPALMSTRLLQILYISSRLCLRRCPRDSQLRSESIFVAHPGVFVE